MTTTKTSILPALISEQEALIKQLQDFISGKPPDQAREYFAILGAAVDQYETLSGLQQ